MLRGGVQFGGRHSYGTSSARGSTILHLLWGRPDSTLLGSAHGESTRGRLGRKRRLIRAPSMLTTSPAGSSRGRLSSLAVNGCWEGGKHGLGGRWREMAWCWERRLFLFFFLAGDDGKRLGQKDKGGHSSRQGSGPPATGQGHPSAKQTILQWGIKQHQSKLQGSIQRVGQSVVCS